jgi:hypothetical protein
MKECQLFFELLRAAMREEPLETGSFGTEPTEAAWTALYQMAWKQSLTGVIYSAVARLPREQQPPMALAIQWASEAEEIRGLNALLNSEAARLTRLFADNGRRTAILKGQANARLYPDPMSRQPGDIDIWVEGGHESVTDLLMTLGMLNERPSMRNYGKKGKATSSYHHVHLPPTKDGVTVEVHFRPSSGNFNAITNKRLQQWLEREIQQTAMVPEGFSVPSVRFALVMQLAHIQHHFIASGIGLRQVCDYYLLLQNSTEEERTEVAGLLKQFGLHRTAGALMWLLSDLLHIDRGLMLCETDDYRGAWMLRRIMEGGNFGHYASSVQQNIWRDFFQSKWHRLKMMRFDFWEVLWLEGSYWKTIVRTLPERIRRRKLSLRTCI